MKINMRKFVEDYKAGKIVDGWDGGLHITNYIYNNQPDTELWHYVNQDVYIQFDVDNDFVYVEDYGNGCPNWVSDTLNKMLKAIKDTKVGVK